jgi:hypothetical protein
MGLKCSTEIKHFSNNKFIATEKPCVKFSARATDKFFFSCCFGESLFA